MNRRTFSQVMATAALGAALPPAKAAPQKDAAAKPPFPLSVMLWTVFNKLPFEERLAKVAEAGYSHVELVGEYNQEKWSEADFARINAARKRLGIEFDATAGLSHGVADPESRPALLAELAGALKQMEALECPAMILLSGNVIPGLTREAQHRSCVDSLRQAAKLVEGRQIAGKPIRLLLETIDPEENPKYFLTSMTEAFEIVRQVNHPQVQVLYDFFHEQIAEGNLIEKLEKNIDLIGLVHVADVPGRREPGTGEINYPNIYRKLAALKYRHYVAMEFLPLGEPVAALRAAAKGVSQAVSQRPS